MPHYQHMKTYLYVFFLSLSLLAPRLAAADATAKPGPEHQKFAPWTGRWKFVVEVFDNPWERAGKETGIQESRTILGGLFQVNKVKTETADGPRESFEVVAYDSEKEHYQSSFFASDGFFNQASKGDNATATVQGDTWTWSWTEEKDGKRYQVRQVGSVSSDRKTSTWVTTYSEDGKTWKTRNEAKVKRVAKLRDE